MLAMGKEMPHLIENWDKAFNKYSNGNEFIDKEETAQMIKDIHAGYLQNIDRNNEEMQKQDVARKMAESAKMKDADE